MVLEANAYWGNQTASIDWCEKNYEVTYYIAEFWNTVSNLALLLLAVYGIFKSIRFNLKFNKKGNKFYITNSMFACYLGLSLVGMGSWMFHMTLHYSMQLLDELPMLYGISIGMYAYCDLLISAFELENQVKRSALNRNGGLLCKLCTSRLAVFISLFTYCVSVTYIYVNVWTDPVFHQMSFGIILSLGAIATYKCLKLYKLSKRLYALSIFYFVLGFLFWNLDNHLCESLRYYRDSVEGIFGVRHTNLNEFNLKAVLFNGIIVSLKAISEFHSLWHVFTGMASFLAVVCMIELSYEHHLKKTRLLSEESPVCVTCFNLFYDFSTHEENEVDIKDRKIKQY